MKILAIFKGSYPNGGPMSKRLHLYCKGLIEQNHEVKILIPLKTVKYGSVQNVTILKGVYDGVSYEYLPSNIVRSNNFFIRRIDDVFSYIYLCIQLLKNENKSDVILIVDIRNVVLVLIHVMSRLTNSKTVYEINEHPSILVNKLQLNFDKLITYRLFDGFILISESLVELISRYKKSNARILKLPIVSEDSDPPKIVAKTYSEKYILHTGGLINSKDGIVGMIEAFSIAVNHYNKDIYFYFTGSFSKSGDCELIRSAIAKNGVEGRVRELGYLTETDLKIYQKNCAMVIINKDNNLQNNYCFPTKLGEYLSMAKPVIITRVGPQMEYLTDGINSYIVEPSDVDGLAKKIVEVLNDDTRSQLIGLEGKKVADEHFNYKKQSQRLSKFFKELL